MCRQISPISKKLHKQAFSGKRKKKKKKTKENCKQSSEKQPRKHPKTWSNAGSDSTAMEWQLKFCVSNKLPDNANAAGSCTTLLGSNGTPLSSVVNIAMEESGAT